MNKLALICILFFSAYLGLTTINLDQNNDESLFLNTEQSVSFHKFKRDFNDSSNILVSFISDDVQDIKNKIIDLQTKFTTIDVIKNEKNFLFEFTKSNYYTINIKFTNLKNRFDSEAVIKHLLNLNGPNLKVKIVGYPYNNFLLDQSSRDINSVSFPILFIICFVMLMIFIRHFINSLLLFIPSINAALLSLYIIKLYVGSLNAINSVVPLLNFVIYLTLVLHLYYSNFDLKRKLIPTFLTVITTAIGFGSLYVSDIMVIRDFAIVSFISIMINFIVVYAVMFFLKPFFKPKLLRYDFILNFIKNREMKLGQIIVLSLLLIFGSILSFSKIRINTNLVDFFSDKTKLKDHLEFFEQNIMGLPILEILVEKKQDETDTDFDFVKLMNDKEKKILDRFPDLKLISKAKLVESANQLYTQNKQIPSNLNAYAGVVSNIPQDLKEGYINDDFYRITVLGKQLSFDEYNNFLSQMKLTLEQQNIVKYKLGGFFYSVVTSHYSIIQLLIWSFFSSCLIIFIIIGIYFRNYKLLLIFSLVNLIPISSFFLFLNLANFSLNLATVKVFSISLGLMVDNAIHICYEKKLEDNLIAPILFGAIILMVSFIVLGFSEFIPIREFAFSMVYLLFIGITFSLLILPKLLKKITFY